MALAPLEVVCLAVSGLVSRRQLANTRVDATECRGIDGRLRRKDRTAMEV